MSDWSTQMTQAVIDPPRHLAGRLTGLLAPVVLALAAFLLPAGASAAPAQFWTQEVGKSLPGARGVAVAPESAPNRGHVFVADQEGSRVVEYTAWGQLVKIWGWDVVLSGPGESAEDKFEVCAPTAGDLCKAGTKGSGVGQLNAPEGMAVDSVGNVYVVDWLNLRVQKFDPEGDFMLMFGDGVNQGPNHPGGVCTATHLAEGDTCGAGKEGAGEGQFSWPVVGSFLAVDQRGTSTDVDDRVWVGGAKRIQRFNVGGVYQGEVGVPGEDVNGLAVDVDGFLYATFRLSSFNSKEDVRKLDPGTGEELLKFKGKNPRAVAVADDGDVYVFDKKYSAVEAKIRHFDKTGKEIEAFGDADFFNESTGLATGSACGIEGTDIFFGNAGSGAFNGSPSFVRAYGPPPDPGIAGCAQPAVAPLIAASYARLGGHRQRHPASSDQPILLVRRHLLRRVRHRGLPRSRLGRPGLPPGPLPGRAADRSDHRQTGRGLSSAERPLPGHDLSLPLHRRERRRRPDDRPRHHLHHLQRPRPQHRLPQPGAAHGRLGQPARLPRL